MERLYDEKNRLRKERLELKRQNRKEKFRIFTTVTVIILLLLLVINAKNITLGALNEIEITVDTPGEWTTSKRIIIDYPDGYINEYSYDGKNWFNYKEEIKLSSNTTVYARAVKKEEVICSTSYKITTIDNEIGYISLDEIPDVINVGSDYSIPSSFDFSNVSGGEARCVVNDKEVTNTSQLDIGTHLIKCSATTIAGNRVNVEKSVKVVRK